MFILAIQYRCSITKHYYEEELSDARDMLVDEHRRDGIINANIIDIENREHYFYDADVKLIKTVRF